MSLINRFSFQQRGVIDLNKQIIKGGVEPEEEIKIEEKDDSQEDSTGETGNDNNDQEGADTANKGVLSTKEGDLAIKNNALANMNLNSQMIPISGSVQGSTANFSRIPISGSNIIPAPNSGSGIVSSVLPGSLAIHPIFNPIEITIDNPDVFDKPDKTEYDENGNQIGIWYNDEGKVERKVQYDENGNKEQETKYDEYEHAIEEAVYNEDEVLQSKTTWEYEGRYDSYPVKTEFVYNNGLLVSETKYFGYYPDRISSQILYNENGNKVSETAYGSDGIKDSEKSFYENGQVKKYTVYSYDGDLETETEYYENGNIKQQSLYDYEGKLETETEYDENGNKVSETEYNSNGSKISDKTFYKNGQVQHEKVYNNYDKLDYEIEYNEEGVKTKGIQYNYNKYSKDVLESKTHNTYENGVKTKSEVYDTDGNLISESVFDEAGNVVSETEYAYTLNDDGTKTVTTTKTVDGNSERVSIKYSADGKILEETTYYKTGVQEYRPLQVTTYNEQGLVESIADYEYGNKKSETVFSYDSNGVKTGSKTYDSKNTLQTENTYYANGNVKSEISYTNKGTVFEECYYYENGNKQCYIKYSLDGIKWDEYYYYENGNEKLYIYYSDNGDKAHETTYLEDGTKESYTTYYDNGKEKFKEIYKNCK